MSFSLVASTKGNNVTPAIDTSGANLLVAVFAPVSIFSSITDSKGNTWLEADTESDSNSNTLRILYVYNPTVGTGHTFTTGNDWMGVAVAAFSGAAASPLDQIAAGSNSASGTVTSLASGSITPSEDNELLIAGLSLLNDAVSTSGITADGADGFTLQEALNAVGSGVSNGCALAYQIQTTAAARNHDWSWTGAVRASNSMVSFKAATGGAGGGGSSFVPSSSMKIWV